MRFTVSRKKLSQALALAARVIPTRGTIPVLENVRIEAVDTHLSIRATNMDIAAALRVPATDLQEGTVVLPGRALNSIVSRLRPESLSFEVRGTMLVSEAGGSKYELLTKSVDEFPALEKPPEEGWKSVPLGKLLAGVNRVSFCASRDDPRPFLTGIFLESSGEGLRFVTSDSQRLAFLQSSIECPGLEAIVQRSFAEMLSGVESDTVEVASVEGKFFVKWDDNYAYTRLIPGPYAPYQDVIPKGQGSVFVGEISALEDTVGRLEEFTEPPSHGVRFSFSGEGLTVSASSKEIGRADERVSGNYVGEDIAIGFNAKRLGEILRAIPGDEMRFGLYSPTVAALLEPLENPAGEELRYLIMPLRLDDIPEYG